MKYTLMKFLLIHLLLLYFLLLSEKMYFTAKIFNMHIISMKLTCIHLYVNVFRGLFRTQSNIYDGASLRNHTKSCIVQMLDCFHIRGIAFTVEKVYKSHYLADMIKVDFKNLSLRFGSQINKTHFGLIKKV